MRSGHHRRSELVRPLAGAADYLWKLLIIDCRQCGLYCSFENDGQIFVTLGNERGPLCRKRHLVCCDTFAAQDVEMERAFDPRSALLAICTKVQSAI